MDINQIRKPEHEERGVTPRWFQYPRSTLQSQLSAKLCCLKGYISDTDYPNTPYGIREDFLCACARSRVYDVHYYAHDNWGPFLDSVVDWEKAETLMIVVAYNLQLIAQREDFQLDYADGFEYPSSKSLIASSWRGAFAGVTPNSFTGQARSVPEGLDLPIESQDPYNITGRWMRILVFLDYSVFWDFNFSENRPEEGFVRAPLTARRGTGESTMLIGMSLQTVSICRNRSEQILPTVNFKGHALLLNPPTNFNGKSRVEGETSQSKIGVLDY